MRATAWAGKSFFAHSFLRPVKKWRIVLHSKLGVCPKLELQNPFCTLLVDEFNLNYCSSAKILAALWFEPKAGGLAARILRLCYAEEKKDWRKRCQRFGSLFFFKATSAGGALSRKIIWIEKKVQKQNCFLCYRTKREKKSIELWRRRKCRNCCPAAQPRLPRILASDRHRSQSWAPMAVKIWGPLSCASNASESTASTTCKKAIPTLKNSLTLRRRARRCRCTTRLPRLPSPWLSLCSWSWLFSLKPLFS